MSDWVLVVNHNGNQESPTPAPWDNVNNNVEQKEEKRPLKWIDIVSIGTLMLIMYCNWSAIAVMAPFFPTEAEKRDVSATMTGLIISAFYFVCFLTSPVVGYLIPKIGSRRLLLIGSFGNSIATALFGVIELAPNPALFISLCFGVRIFQAIGTATCTTVVYAIYPTRYPDRVAFLFGLTETFNGLGLMSGPFIGGALYEVHGFGLPFYFISCLAFLASVGALITLSSVSDVDQSSSVSMFRLLSHIDIVLVLGTVTTDSFAQMFLEPILAVHLETFSLRPILVGTVFLAWAVLYSIAAPVYGKIAEKYGYLMTIMILNTFFSSLSFLLLGPAPFFNIRTELWTTIVGLAGLGLAGGGTYVAPMVALLIITINHGHPNNLATYGLVAGLFNGAYSLGGFAGSGAAGVLVDLIGFSWGCVCVAGLFVVNLIALVAFAIKHRKPNQDIFTQQTPSTDESSQRRYGAGENTSWSYSKLEDLDEKLTEVAKRLTFDAK